MKPVIKSPGSIEEAVVVPPEFHLTHSVIKSEKARSNLEKLQNSLKIIIDDILSQDEVNESDVEDAVMELKNYVTECKQRRRGLPTSETNLTIETSSQPPPPKRPRGRPKKNPPESTSQIVVPTTPSVKRGRGRPRKYPLVTPPPEGTPRRKPGRPRKNQTLTEPAEENPDEPSSSDPESLPPTNQDDNGEASAVAAAAANTFGNSYESSLFPKKDDQKTVPRYVVNELIANHIDKIEDEDVRSAMFGVGVGGSEGDGGPLKILSKEETARSMREILGAPGIENSLINAIEAFEREQIGNST